MPTKTMELLEDRNQRTLNTTDRQRTVRQVGRTEKAVAQRSAQARWRATGARERSEEVRKNRKANVKRV